MVTLPLLLSLTYLNHAHAFADLPSRRMPPANVAASSAISPPNHLHRPRNNTPLRMTQDNDYDDDGHEEDECNPLSKGIDSVSWLPTVMGSRARRSIIESSSSSPQTDDDVIETLPLFPLGGIVYTPNSEHILNIFEPRYRQMYGDIIMNGSKRFVVAMCHPSEEGRFAKVGVLFSLQELKEVGEMTQDRVKYICNHRVTGRVKLHEVINPEAWEKRDTYLKVRGTIIDDTGYYRRKLDQDEDESGDSDMDENISKKLVKAVLNAARADSLEKTPEEESLFRSFSDLVELQHEMEEDVRFTRASVKSFGIAEGTDIDPNLWTSIRLWQSYAEQRLVATQNEMQKEFQERLVEFLKRESGSDKPGEELPSVIGFQDLSPALQQELMDLQLRMTRELKPLLLEQTLSMQKILEAENHTQRVELMRYFVDAERKRLQAKKTLKSMFSGDAVISRKEIEERRAEQSKEDVETRLKPQFFEDESSSKPQYFEDDDSFQ